MRAWRSSGGVLVDEGPSEVPIISDLAEQIPKGPWRDRRRFVLFDAQGRVRTRYYDSVWSIDDELGASLHAIIDGALRELTVTIHTTSTWTVRRKETSVLGGLREIPAGDAESWEWIRRAFDAEKASQVQAAEDRAKERAARRAAVADALQDFGAGPDFARAQKVLGDRVEQYGGDLETNLLKALGRFGALHRVAPIRPALDEFVRACRRAAFDSTYRVGKPETSATRPPASAELQALAATLDHLRKTLEEKAVEQEWADANQNAAAYRKAADHVGRSAELLRPPA